MSMKPNSHIPGTKYSNKRGKMGKQSNQETMTGGKSQGELMRNMDGTQCEYKQAVKKSV